MNKMGIIINFIEAVFFLFAAFWGILYYTGRVNYDGKKEEIRKERVKRYGWLMIASIVLLVVGGLGLLVVTF